VGATGFSKKPHGFCYQGLSTGFIYLKWIYFARGKGDFSAWLPIECVSLINPKEKNKISYKCS